jgi:hypothetical protein
MSDHEKPTMPFINPSSWSSEIISRTPPPDTEEAIGQTATLGFGLSYAGEDPARVAPALVPNNFRANLPA